jgi:hypothetical protein
MLICKSFLRPTFRIFLLPDVVIGLRMREAERVLMSRLQFSFLKLLNP